MNMDAKDEIAFFQAVKARLAKFDETVSGKTDEELETVIRIKTGGTYSK